LMMRVQLPDEDTAFATVQSLFLKASQDPKLKTQNRATDEVRLAVQDACKRLLAPAMETEMRLESKKRADEAAKIGRATPVTSCARRAAVAEEPDPDTLCLPLAAAPLRPSHTILLPHSTSDAFFRVEHSCMLAGEMVGGKVCLHIITVGYGSVAFVATMTVRFF